MTTTTLYDKIRDYLTGLDDDAIVQIWNEYIHNNNYFDDEIFDAETMEEIIENSAEGALYWVNRFFYGSDDYGTDEASANPNRNFFRFNGYGNIISFDYIYNQFDDTFHHIEVDDMIDYIIENNDSLCDDGIQEILDEKEENQD